MRCKIMLFAGALVLVACSSGVPEDSSTLSVTVDTAEIAVDEVELETAAPRVGSEKEWINALALNWGKENAEYSESQAACVGESIVKELSIERLEELGVAIDSVNEDMVVANFSAEDTEKLEEIASQCKAN